MQTNPEITRLLSREIDCARILLQTLERENQALTRGEVEEIEAVSALKQQQMQQLQQLLLMRDRFLEHHDLTPGKPGTEQLLERFGQPDNARALWQDLQELAARLREQNEINGGIVALGHQHVRQALDLLTGRCSGNDTYGPAGNRHPARLQHSLAKA